MRVLLVEDDTKLGEQVVEHLERAGYDTTWLERGDAVATEHVEACDLMILDLMLPGTYGLDVLKTTRSTCDVPILVLSAKQDTSVRVRALELGADDYMTKPFWPEELVARVGARIRRPMLKRGGAIEVGKLTIDLEGRRVLVESASIELTKVEFDLLAALARRQGSAVQRAWLAENVLDTEREGTERTLDVHVSRLRKKLGACSTYLTTVWGVGYRLESGDTE
ncbi:MAG: DNA-binding response OmpR family regulator [Planctomycetota bacterium]|jgi:DNA-binding response OmpR family regulator